MARLKKIVTKKNLLISLCLLFIVAIYRNDTLVFKAVNYVNIKTGGAINLSAPRNLIMHLVDDINPLKGKIWNKKFDLPIVNLALSKEDLEHFQNVVAKAKKSSPYAFYMPNEVNESIDINMTINDIKYKSEIKLHGTNNPHFSDRKKSYSLKIRNSDGKEYPYGMRRFALIIPSQSNLIAVFTYKVASMIGMISPKNFLVRVYINGIDQGVYHLEEKLNKTLLERNGKSGHDVVRSDDSWAHQYADNHGTMFSFDYSGIQQGSTSDKNLEQIVLFKELLNSDDIEFIKNNINLNEFIKYDVLRYLFGDSGHMTSNDNLKLIYNTSNGRIEPYFRIENHIEEIQTNSLTFSPERHVNIGAFKSNKLLSNLTRDDSYREARNRAIYKMLLKEDEINKLFNEIIKKDLGVLLNDTTNILPSRYFKYELDLAKEYLSHNFNFLKKYLSYSRVFIEIIKKESSSIDIVIKPDSNSPIKTSSFKLIVDESYIGKYVDLIDTKSGKITTLKVAPNENGKGFISLHEVLEDHSFSLSLDQYLEPRKKSYLFKLKFNGIIDTAEVIFKNDITDETILKRDTYVAIVNESIFLKSEVPSFFKKIDDKNLLLTEGSYNFFEDLILPHGINLTIEAGVNIYLDYGVSILTRGNLNINGTKEKLVNIQPMSNKPFGVFGVVGDGYSKVNINGLNIFGGNEDVINGIYLSGALSIYNQKFTKIKNSKIHHNHADDGLNIKNSEVVLQRNHFFLNAADQVDLDSASGIVENNTFSGSADDKDRIFDIELDTNGDGLDLSDSLINIKYNMFEGFADKGISIGENTKALILNNIFKKNRSAITAKDESKVFVSQNDYAENEIQLEMYQKKLFFKHPSVYNINEKHANNKIRKTIDSNYYKQNIIDLSNISPDEITFEFAESLEWILYE